MTRRTRRAADASRNRAGGQAGDGASVGPRAERAHDFAIDETHGGVAFWIHATPSARRSHIGGTHGDALRVAVSSPPVAGRANAACVRAIAQALDVPRADVRLQAGSRGRRKRVEIVAAGQKMSSLRRRLHALATA